MAIIFFNKVSLLQKYLVTIFIDNNRSINMTKTYQWHKKTKYIDVCHHFIKEKVETEEFKLVYMNMADLLIKALLHNATQSFALDLGLWKEKKQLKKKQNKFLVVTIPGKVLERCDY